MKRTGGFTLLEITVTLAILGVVLLIVYGVFSRTLEAKERVESRVDAMAAARATFQRMQRDLHGMVYRIPTPQQQPGQVNANVTPPPEPLFLSRDRTEGGVPFDGLAFTAMLARPVTPTLSATDVATVRYTVLPDPSRPGTLALFRETAFTLSGNEFDRDQPNPQRTVLVLDDVEGLQFRFYDGREWIEEWDSKDPEMRGPAPQAVEISLLLSTGPSQPDVFRTTVDLPMVPRVQDVAGRPGSRND